DRKSTRLNSSHLGSSYAVFCLKKKTSFSHLFSASHHDFYTATHMVNVATWMVPLAYALGTHDAEQLNRICQAGMLHDIGKIFIPGEVLNKAGKLSDSYLATIKPPTYPLFPYTTLFR